MEDFVVDKSMFTSVNPVHNFNNVWFMFLVFKKKLLSFQTTVGPPLLPGSFAFLVLYPVHRPQE